MSKGLIPPSILSPPFPSPLPVLIPSTQSPIHALPSLPLVRGWGGGLGRGGGVAKGVPTGKGAGAGKGTAGAGKGAEGTQGAPPAGAGAWGSL